MEAKRTGALVFVAAVGILGLMIVFGTWYTVGAGEQAVVTQFGAISKVTGPGLHFKLPLMQNVDKIDVRAKYLEWSGDSVMHTYSKDQQPAELSIKVTYRALADSKSIISLYTTYRDLDGFINAVLVPRTFEGVKTVFGQFNAVTAIQERARLNAEVEAMVRKLVVGPVFIEGVQIQNIDYSDEYEKAVEARMQAQVEVEKITQNLERERKQAEIKVVQATANAQAVKLAGEAEASAIRARGDALRENQQLVGLVAAEKWNGVLPTTMIPGTTLPFIDVK